MRLTRLGHSCLLVEAADQRVLVDPGGWSTGFEQLRDLDAIVVTHEHGDHVDYERLPALVRANPQAALLVEAGTCDDEDIAPLEPMPFTAASDLRLGELRLRGLGDRHALINEFVPQVGNTGLVLTADGEPSLYHPGDAIDADPRDLGVELDVLAAPLAAPWCASKETVAFVRRLAPRTIVPIHDAILSASGRGVYLGHLQNFSLDDSQVVDPDHGEATAVSAH